MRQKIKPIIEVLKEKNGYVVKNVGRHPKMDEDVIAIVKEISNC